MPVAFTEAERERITASLKETGRRLFATVGLKKTSLADLTSAVGIVKSSFYSFFASKEALYLELMLERTADIRRITVANGLALGADTQDSLRRFLRGAVRVLDTDPLYRRLSTHPEEVAMVRRRVGPDAIAVTGANGMAELADFVAERQVAGELPGSDPIEVLGALRSVLLLPLHAHEFGESYPAVVDLAIESLTAGLVDAARPRADCDCRS